MIQVYSRATAELTGGRLPNQEMNMKANLSLLNATTKLLRRGYRNGLTVNQIIENVVNKGLWTTDAPTPDRTLRTILCRELAKGKDSRFIKIEVDDGVRFAANR
jgi:hypothetical protein